MKATIVLLPLLGLTWLIGIISVNNDTIAFAWIFTILNSLQVDSYELSTLSMDFKCMEKYFCSSVGCIHFVFPCAKKPRGILTVNLIFICNINIFTGEKAYYNFTE